MAILRFVPFGGFWKSCHHSLAEGFLWEKFSHFRLSQNVIKILKGGDVYRC